MVSCELIEYLLSRGDHIAIERGCLEVRAASGNAVPDQWLIDNNALVVGAILGRLGISAFEYVGYSAGKYGKHLAGGVTLQFLELTTREPAFVIYPAEVTRSKTTLSGNAGSPLPKNHFRITKATKLYKFWLRTGLPIPRRVSSFHDYMGGLKSVLFQAIVKNGEKLDKDSLAPVNVSNEKIKQAFSINLLMDNARTNFGHATDNYRTIVSDKIMPKKSYQQGFEGSLSAGHKKYGKRLTGKSVIGSVVVPINVPKTPEEQTTDEWISDLG